MNARVRFSCRGRHRFWIYNLVNGLAGTTIKVKHAVFCASSPFQKIEVFDTYHYGQVLCLGGSVVLTERDGDIYHEMIVHPAMLSHVDPRNVCIIGGGDGGCLKEVLKHPCVESVPSSISTAWSRIRSKALFPRLAAVSTIHGSAVTIDDGFHFLKTTDALFDCIIVDSYDPGGPCNPLKLPIFIALPHSGWKGRAGRFPDRFSDCQARISPADAFAALAPFRGGQAVHLHAGLVPEGICSFVLCGREKEALDRFDGQRYAVIADSCVYYNRDIHTGAFLLPQYLTKKYVEGGA